MRLRPIASLMIGSLWLAQMPIASAQQAAASPTVVVPAGTLIPLTLVSPIKSKSTKPGDSIRAQVAFPITIGSQIAIPAGTYAEGVLEPAPKKNKRDSSQPAVQIHFTRLLFANGYTVSLDAMNTAETQAPVINPPADNTMLAESKGYGPSDGREFGFEPEPQILTPPPTLPPLPHEGPSEAAVAGGVLGGTAAILVTLLVVSHHHNSHVDYLLYDAGWQFQMTLQGPLTLDVNRVAAAAATKPN